MVLIDNGSSITLSTKKWQKGLTWRRHRSYDLPLVCPDVVLGVEWLEGLGRVISDYKKGTMEFSRDNGTAEGSGAKEYRAAKKKKGFVLRYSGRG